MVRHGKSAWDSGAPSDHARPLSRRGQRDAPRMGALLQERGWHPDAVWCSTAVRAAQTWHRMAAGFRVRAPVRFDDALYHGGWSAVRSCADQWDDAHRCIAVVGHNPGWEDLVARLTGQATRLTTANVARLQGHGASWGQALDGPWTLDAVLRPRPPRGIGSGGDTAPPASPCNPTSN